MTTLFDYRKLDNENELIIAERECVKWQRWICLS